MQVAMDDYLGNYLKFQPGLEQNPNGIRWHVETVKNNETKQIKPFELLYGISRL